MGKIRLTNNDRLTLMTEFSAMLSAGIPIAKAIDSMLSESRGGLKQLLTKLKADVGSGKTLSGSLAENKGVFDPVTISLIRAAEESGKLESTLGKIKENIKKQMAFNAKVKGALTYPATIFIVFIGVILLILLFVIPRIAQVFMRLKMQLPLPTRILIALSNFMTTNTLLFIGLLVAVFLVGLFLYQFKKAWLVTFFSSLPLIKPLTRQIDLARFADAMAVLLGSGIPIGEAFDLSRDIVVRNDVKKMVSECQKVVSGGGKMSEGLLKFPQIVPPTFVRIAVAGEESGSLEKSMSELSGYFEEKTTDSLKTITTLIEPIMLVVVGVMVGGMMLSIIAPIYNLIGQIKTR